MNATLWIAGVGLVWWLLFAWMRGWERFRSGGTQHLNLLSLIGLAAFVGSSATMLLKRFF